MTQFNGPANMLIYFPDKIVYINYLLIRLLLYLPIKMFNNTIKVHCLLYKITITHLMKDDTISAVGQAALPLIGLDNFTKFVCDNFNSGVLSVEAQTSTAKQQQQMENSHHFKTLDIVNSKCQQTNVSSSIKRSSVCSLKLLLTNLFIRHDFPTLLFPKMTTFSIGFCLTKIYLFIDNKNVCVTQIFMQKTDIILI
ncbi:hypothetical protein AGLY_004541 [Aphis glycines]|uniref:Uncharacterized protein n=1 Tax=Aphis glycines TaxID=307491 RepID=A0A6G0TYF0_APHGL|nr:hypothetical protein AGLY_004541 [Aphis glycines]